MKCFLSLSRKPLFLFVILFSAINVFSQQKSHYSLLWKISGKGLAKPSYLFGTIHVKDKRVFNFSDSVMLALQNCPRFALEVHPDTLMRKLFELFQNKDSLRTLDKLLSKDQYDQLAKKFEDKHGYKMGKMDPMVLEALIKPSDAKPDDQATFVDAYLYGIARTLNKHIAGLEKASTQIDIFGSTSAIKERLLDELDDDQAASKDEEKENLIAIYSTGDLDAIYDHLFGQTSEDSVIVARNKVMVAGMMKYMTDEPLFTAVGAAHLPGEHGIIALLRNAGYTVTKVQASFSGVANTFHIDYSKMNWQTFRDENLGYAINFPGDPFKISLYGTHTVTYPDLASGLYYGINTVSEETPDKPLQFKAIIDQKVAGLSENKKNKVLSRKDFQFNKIPCTELLLTTPSGYMRMRLLLVNNFLYSIYAGSKANQLNVPQVERYFNSFTYFEARYQPGMEWIDYTNNAGAFTIKLPTKPQLIKKDVPATFKGKQVIFNINLYVSTDTVGSKTYLVRYNDYPANMYVNDKEALFKRLFKEFETKGKIISGPVKIVKDGMEGRALKITITGGFNAVVQMYLRGNRTYLLLEEITQAGLKDLKPDAFFDSFKILPYSEPGYYEYKPDSENFKVKLVAAPKLVIDSNMYESYLTKSVSCVSTNPASGGVYDFEYSKISPYYRIQSRDSLYSLLTKQYAGYRDSLIRKDTVLIGGLKGRELLTLNKETGFKKRTRLLIDDENVFGLTGYMDNSELFDKTNEVFFNSLSFTHPPANKIDLAASKAEKIGNDLASKDSIVMKSAAGALSYYHFTPAELPYLYKAIKHSYPNDSLGNAIKVKLINTFGKVNNDSTIDVLVRFFHHQGQSDKVKEAILTTIPLIDKKVGYNTYLNLLVTNPLGKIAEGYDLFQPLTDSIEFSAAHFSQLLPLINHTEYRTHILNITRMISGKKDENYDKMLKANFNALMAYSEKDLDDFLALKDSDVNKWGGNLYNYFQLLGNMHTTALADKFTNRYLAKDHNGTYATDAVITRISNNLPNNQLLVNKLLDSMGTRYDIMEAYQKQKQLDRVPLKYRKQDEYAKLCLYQYISSDDYGSPTSLALLGSIVKHGAVYYVFKYRLSEKEETKQLIGIAGPFVAGSSLLKFDKYYAYSDYDILQTNWREQATKLIDPLNEGNN